MKLPTRLIHLGTAALVTASCAGSGPPAKDLASVPSNDMSAVDKQFAALRASDVQKDAKLDKMSVQIADYFAGRPTQARLRDDRQAAVPAGRDDLVSR